MYLLFLSSEKQREKLLWHGLFHTSVPSQDPSVSPPRSWTLPAYSAPHCPYACIRHPVGTALSTGE